MKKQYTLSLCPQILQFVNIVELLMTEDKLETENCSKHFIQFSLDKKIHCGHGEWAL